MNTGLREHETGNLKCGGWSGSFRRIEHVGPRRTPPYSSKPLRLGGTGQNHGGVDMDWEEPTVEVLTDDDSAFGADCETGVDGDTCFTNGS